MILDYIPSLIFEISKVFYNSEQLKIGGCTGDVQVIKGSTWNERCKQCVQVFCTRDENDVQVMAKDFEVSCVSIKNLV